MGLHGKGAICLALIGLLGLFPLAGIRSQVFAGDVSLAWDQSVSPTITGNKLYVGNASRTYGAPITLPLSTTYTVTGLTAGTYFFAVTAFDPNGESEYSNEVSAVVQEELPTPVEVIVDNAPAGTRDSSRSFTGTWCKSTATSGFYGVDTLLSCGAGLDTYRFTPTLIAGRYRVYVRWYAYSTRSQTVPITVAYQGGSETKTFDQRANSNQWVLFGEYDFASTGAYVEISDANGQACADAVRFEPVTAAEKPLPPTNFRIQ